METFIAKVQEAPLLYNTAHPDYMNITLKESTWQTIAEELNYEDGAQAKSMWRKLRNCHRDALRRRDRLTLSSTSIIRPWKYEQQMSFLLEFMANRTASGQSQASLNDTDADYRIKFEDESSFLGEHQDAQDPFVETNGFDNVSESSFEIKSSSRVGQKQKRKRSKSRDKRTDAQAPSCSDACPNNDELYHFYMSMYNITRKLPLSRQIRVKRKIFELVTEQQEQACSAEEK